MGFTTDLPPFFEIFWASEYRNYIYLIQMKLGNIKFGPRCLFVSQFFMGVQENLNRVKRGGGFYTDDDVRVKRHDPVDLKGNPINL